MKIPIYQVDAFTSEIFKGNPAAVCPLNQWLPEITMQKIAMENNLSETAFFIEDKDIFHIRWFTPKAELDLAGHPTLATAHVIMRENKKKLSKITFKTKINDILNDNPEKVNEDPYKDGWMVKIKIDKNVDLDGLLNAEKYNQLIT